MAFSFATPVSAPNGLLAALMADSREAPAAPLDPMMVSSHDAPVEVWGITPDAENTPCALGAGAEVNPDDEEPMLPDGGAQPPGGVPMGPGLPIPG